MVATESRNGERSRARGSVFWGVVVAAFLVVAFLGSAFVWIPDGPLDLPAANPSTAASVLLKGANDY